RGGVARGDRQTVPCERLRDRAPGGAATDDDTVAADETDAVERGEVDDETVVDGAEPGEGVAAAAHGDRASVGGGGTDRAPDVVDVPRPEHDGGAGVAERGAGGLGVVGRVGCDDGAPDAAERLVGGAHVSPQGS